MRDYHSDFLRFRFEKPNNMKSISKNSINILPVVNLQNICGGRSASDSGFPWGKVIVMVIGAWSSIKSGLYDGFYDGIE